MGVTPQELHEFWLMIQAIGSVLYIITYTVGVSCCLFVFIVGAAEIAGWIFSAARSEKGRGE